MNKIYIYLILSIIVTLFIHSTSVREGLKGRKKKNKKSDNEDDEPAAPVTAAATPVTAPVPVTASAPVTAPATAAPVQTTAPVTAATAPVTAPVTTMQTTSSATTAPVQTTATTATPATTENVKSILENITPAILASLLKPQVDEIKQTQATIAQTQEAIAQTQADLNKNASKINNQQNKINTDMNKMTSYYKDLSLNMFNQYTMYKTSLANESNLGLSSIKSSVQNAKTSAEEAKKNADNARNYADKTQSIHRDVFGKTTSAVIKNDLANAYEGFSSKEGLGSIYDYSTANNNQNAFELQKTVVEKLNDFNTKYAAYMKCQVTTCSVNNITETTVQNAATALQDAIAELKSKYDETSYDIPSSTYDANHQAILDKANNILSTRAELDQKITNIMQPKHELTRFYDSTIYTKIVLSVLASSLAYFIITER